MKVYLSIVLATGLFAAPPKPKTKPEPVAAAPAAKTLRMDERTVATINAKIRFETLIVFPQGEVIQKAGCGDLADANADRGSWVVTIGDQKRPSNILHLKPGVAGVESDLHLVTNRGTYTFWLKEVSKSCPTCAPDVKIFVDPVYAAFANPEPDTAALDKKKITELETKVVGLQGDVIAAQHQARVAKADADAEAEKRIAEYKRRFPALQRCDFDFKHNHEPFNVGAICTDGSFTYIFSGSRSVESIYEEKPDGVSLVQWTYERGNSNHDGVYIVRGIVTKGHMQSGKKKRLKFGIKG